MCGIAGLLGTVEPEEPVVADVRRMIGTLVHRGPDDAGVASGPGWALGMQRLAIQDTSAAGHQPMQLGSLTLVYNGEVYNFPELRRELEAAGYQFRSGCDTEVVLYALDHWGTGALERFNGMFALALVDASRRRAWLARDRFGKKPLFIARLRRGIAFASELKAILEIARPELHVSSTALRQYFRFQYVPTPACIFEEVQKMPAASWVEIDLGDRSMSAFRRFWDLPDHQPLTAPDLPQEVLATVRQAVSRRLIADVPVGAFLSGGTDSSLVVACMCDANVDVRTFSIGFADPRFDESPYANAVARHLGTDHTHLELGPSEAMAFVPDLVQAYDEPFADSSAIPTMAVARLARRNVTVALSGDGGDELFGGYTRYRFARFLGLTPLIRPAAPLLAALPAPARLGQRLKLASVFARAGSAAQAYREIVSVWRSPELGRLMPDARAEPREWVSVGQNGYGKVEQMMRWDAGTYLVDDILQKVDRATMAVSLEARNPLLDPDVVELAFSAADWAESAPGRKPLLRSALRLRLPAALVDRPKMGFGLPIGEWMRRDLRPLVEDLVLARREAEYDLEFARSVCTAHLSGATDASAQVWSLLMYELWRQRWLAALS